MDNTPTAVNIGLDVSEQSLGKKAADWRRLVCGDDNYQPTQLQSQTLLDYIADDQGRTPTQILTDNGRDRDNWWIWPKRYPGFLDWWNSIIEHVMSSQRLHDMYLALYRRALTHDTGAAKLIAQRFDPKYVERSAQDQRHSFAGYEPAAADDSRDRQRKAIASTALPDGPEQRTGGPDTPALPEPAQAQEQSASAEQTQPEQASNDTIADSKPIKPIEGAGEGV